MSNEWEKYLPYAVPEYVLWNLSKEIPTYFRGTVYTVVDDLDTMYASIRTSDDVCIDNIRRVEYCKPTEKQYLRDYVVLDMGHIDELPDTPNSTDMDLWGVLISHSLDFYTVQKSAEGSTVGLPHPNDSSISKVYYSLEGLLIDYVLVARQGTDPHTPTRMCVIIPENTQKELLQCIENGNTVSTYNIAYTVVPNNVAKQFIGGTFKKFSTARKYTPMNTISDNKDDNDSDWDKAKKYAIPLGIITQLIDGHHVTINGKTYETLDQLDVDFATYRKDTDSTSLRSPCSADESTIRSRGILNYLDTWIILPYRNLHTAMELIDAGKIALTKDITWSSTGIVEDIEESIWDKAKECAIPKDIVIHLLEGHRVCINGNYYHTFEKLNEDFAIYKLQDMEDNRLKYPDDVFENIIQKCNMDKYEDTWIILPYTFGGNINQDLRDGILTLSKHIDWTWAHTDPEQSESQEFTWDNLLKYAIPKHMVEAICAEKRIRADEKVYNTLKDLDEDFAVYTRDDFNLGKDDPKLIVFLKDSDYDMDTYTVDWAIFPWIGGVSLEEYMESGNIYCDKWVLDTTDVKPSKPIPTHKILPDFGPVRIFSTVDALPKDKVVNGAVCVVGDEHNYTAYIYSDKWVPLETENSVEPKYTWEDLLRKNVFNAKSVEQLLRIRKLGWSINDSDICKNRIVVPKTNDNSYMYGREDTVELCGSSGLFQIDNFTIGKHYVVVSKDIFEISSIEGESMVPINEPIKVSTTSSSSTVTPEPTTGYALCTRDSINDISISYDDVSISGQLRSAIPTMDAIQELIDESIKTSNLDKESTMSVEQNVISQARGTVKIELIDSDPQVPATKCVVKDFGSVVIDRGIEAVIRNLIMTNDLNAAIEEYNKIRTKIVSKEILKNTGNKATLPPIEELDELTWIVDGKAI